MRRAPSPGFSADPGPPGRARAGQEGMARSGGPQDMPRTRPTLPRVLRLGAVLAVLAASARAETIDVRIQNYQFTGQHLTIQLGDTVRWTNFDGTIHTTTEGTDLILNGNEAWHRQFNGTGTGSFSVTFNAAFLAAFPRPQDTYSYFCVAHTSMRGTITVVQGPGLPFCFCSPLGPCSNRDYGAGCVNSGQLRGGRMLGSGSTSVAADDLVLTVDLLPVNQACILIRGKNENVQTQLGEGWRCIGTPFYRLGQQSTGPNGVYTRGPGLGGASTASGARIQPGETWHFQLWYRDLVSQCGNYSNVSNGYSVRFTP